MDKVRMVASKSQSYMVWSGIIDNVVAETKSPEKLCVTFGGNYNSFADKNVNPFHTNIP